MFKKLISTFLISLLIFESSAFAAEKTYDLSIHYADIFAGLMAAKYEANNYLASDLCSSAGKSNDTRPADAQYSCSEYPFGRTIYGLAPKEIASVQARYDVFASNITTKCQNKILKGKKYAQLSLVNKKK